MATTSKKELPLHVKLAEISKELKAPKSKFNAFGKYYYRSKEDIQEALKPYAVKYGVAIYIDENIVEAPDHNMIEATAVILDDSGKITATSYAGIEKAGGMALPQAYGSASSYAGKYAFGNLFGIDDTVDSDGTNDHGKGGKAPTELKSPTKPEPNPSQIKAMKASVAKGDKQSVIQALDNKYTVSKELRTQILSGK